MSKIIKKISLFLTSIGIILLLGGIFSSLFFSDKIENTVVNSIKKQIPKNINIENVEFKLFENFPFSTVKLEQLFIKEDDSFGQDTLIFAETSYIKFSLIKFIFNQFTIDDISIFNGKVSIKENLSGTNYNFLNNKSDVENEIKLNEIRLFNTEFEYVSENNQTNIFLINSNIKISIDSKKQYAIIGDCINNKTIIGNRNYLDRKKTQLNLNYINEKNKKILKNSFIEIEDLKFFVNGFWDSNKNIDLDIVGVNQNIKSFTQHTPNYLKDIYKSVLLNGEINYTASVKGKVKSDINPQLNIEYSITEGEFQTKKYPFILSNVNCSGIINNGENKNFTTTKVSFIDFKANTKKGEIDGVFYLSNLKKYFLEAEFNSTWAMDEANYYFSESPFYECSGQIITNTKYYGRISFDETFNEHFLNAKHYSNINLKNLNFLYKNYPNQININNASGEIINDSINIKNSLINIKDSDFSYDGDIKNLFSYILSEDKNKINLNGNLYSKTLNLKNIIGAKDDSANEKTEFTIPDYLTMKINSNIETLVYNNVYPNKIQGDFIYKNNSVTSENLELNIFDGRLFFDGKFYKNEKNNFKLTSNIKLKKIDIKKAFSAFNNFGQDFIIDKHIKGKSSANLICNMYWDKYLNLNNESIDVKSKITIEKGELIDFKPLEKLSSYVKLKDLEHIKFSKLENEIKIKDKIISVPNMEINSSALSLIISGKHYFNQEYNYKISLLLSDLLAKRFRAKSNSFNPNDSISPLKTDLQIRMKGNKDDSEIFFEKLKIKENVEKEIKKEILDVKKIIAEELNKKEKEKENEDLEIEWDDSP